jgi:hypothetical protein
MRKWKRKWNWKSRQNGHFQWFSPFFGSVDPQSTDRSLPKDSKHVIFCDFSRPLVLQADCLGVYALPVKNLYRKKGVRKRRPQLGEGGRRMYDIVWQQEEWYKLVGKSASTYLLYFFQVELHFLSQMSKKSETDTACARDRVAFIDLVSCSN